MSKSRSGNAPPAVPIYGKRSGVLEVPRIKFGAGGRQDGGTQAPEAAWAKGGRSRGQLQAGDGGEGQGGDLESGGEVLTAIPPRLARTIREGRWCACGCKTVGTVKVGGRMYCEATATIIAGCTGCNRPRILCECLLAVQA